MFSERLEYDKYYFQHLQGALRCVYGHQKPDVLGLIMKTSLAGVQMVAYCLSKMSIADFFRRAARKFFVDEKI